MSKRDYTRAADVIKTALTTFPESKAALRNVAHGMAITFKADNSAFRRDTFFSACGFDS